MNSSRKFLVSAVVGLILLPICVCADSAPRLVEKGNRAYNAGKYDEALSAYDSASVDQPESPQIYYNKGDAFYQKGDYAKAGEMLEQAAIKTRDSRLEARSRYNLGNCLFREGEKQKDSDLQKALDDCAASIRHYQDALKLDPGFTDAAENIEVVRLTMKAILDEIKKKEEEAAKQKQAQQDAVERLKKLKEEQLKAIEQNQKLSQEKSQQPDSPDLQQKSQDLADQQKNIQKDTQKLAEDMKAASAQTNASQQAQQQASPLDNAAQHLDKAANHQESAAKDLGQQQLDSGRAAQEKAAEELEEALKSLANPSSAGKDSADKKQDGQKPDNKEQESPQQAKQDSGKDEKNQGESQQEVQTAELNEEARDILDEEKSNREQRQYADFGEIKPVDKDW